MDSTSLQMTMFFHGPFLASLVSLGPSASLTDSCVRGSPRGMVHHMEDLSVQIQKVLYISLAKNPSWRIVLQRSNKTKRGPVKKVNTTKVLLIDLNVLTTQWCWPRILEVRAEPRKEKKRWHCYCLIQWVSEWRRRKTLRVFEWQEGKASNLASTGSWEKFVVTEK